MKPVIIIITSILLLLTTLTGSLLSKDNVERKSVHFFDLQSNRTESEFLADLSEINKIIKQLGYKGLEYKFYKIKDFDTSEKYRYYFDSTWPSDNIYEEVHNLPAYRDWRKKMREKYPAQIEKEIYRKVYRIK
jgi:hypothetical protein